MDLLSLSVFFFFQAEDGIRDAIRDWSSDVCSSDLAARGRGDIAGPVGAASESSPLTVRGVRPVLQASVQAALPGRHFRGMIAPNNSFNPNPLRSTNNIANRACPVVGSTTQDGLNQALCATGRGVATGNTSRKVHPPLVLACR